MADESVPTVLSLSLHPSPGISRSREGERRVDLCPSVSSFNLTKDDQEQPVSATPTPDEEFTFTLLSSSTGSKPSSALHLSPVSAAFEDFHISENMEVIPSRLEGKGQWVKKRLSPSDVNDASRLLLPKEDVRKYVLALMDEERCAACHTSKGLRVKVWDLDTISEHELSLKKWKNGSFLLASNWSAVFVKRRSLQEGDFIGLL